MFLPVFFHEVRLPVQDGVRSKVAQVKEERLREIPSYEADRFVIHPIDEILLSREQSFPARAVPGDRLRSENVRKEVRSIPYPFYFRRDFLVESMINGSQLYRGLVVFVTTQV